MDFCRAWRAGQAAQAAWTWRAWEREGGGDRSGGSGEVILESLEHQRQVANNMKVLQRQIMHHQKYDYGEGYVGTDGNCAPDTIAVYIFIVNEEKDTRQFPPVRERLSGGSHTTPHTTPHPTTPHHTTTNTIPPHTQHTHTTPHHHTHTRARAQDTPPPTQSTTLTTPAVLLTDRCAAVIKLANWHKRRVL